MNRQRTKLKPVVASLFEIRRTERLWHIPLLASLCAGIPLFVGLYFDHLSQGIIASIAGLVILYLPATGLANRLITMLACSFGFMMSYTVGILFSFDPLVSAISFASLAAAAQWLANYFRMPPPGSFFFIMIACIAASHPFDISTIPLRVGIVGLGSMLASILGMAYSIYIVSKHPPIAGSAKSGGQTPVDYLQVFITGLFMGSCLLIGHIFKLQNPYWLPISCLAVMQGISIEHIWSRSLQRILGTFIGLGLSWLLLLLEPSPLLLCISIFILQFIVEMLIVRHYGLAVVFITPLTLFLAEAGSAMTADLTVLMPARFLDITIGSIIGAFGGWLIYNRKLRLLAVRRMRLRKSVHS